MFKESAELYDAIYSFKDYPREAARVAALVRETHPTARTLLDVGCGTGEHVLFLAANHGFDADGLDIDAGLLKVARQKRPAARFFEADMSNFAVDRRYDVVLCLFSSIGYLVTLQRVRSAFECFRQHLSPGGVVIVEPWFAPGVLDPARTFQNTSDAGGIHVERVGRVEVEGRLSRLHFDYRIEQNGETRHATEIHELGLFTPEEIGATFSEAGLTADFDPIGLTGRGLWVARSSSPS